MHSPESKIKNNIDTDLLLDRIRAGDKRAFENLVTKYEKSVYRLCYRFFYNEQDAMDATQEVFLKVYRALDGFEGRSSFKTWIYRIAANTCITLAEKHKKEKDGLLQSIIHWWNGREQETPEEEVIGKEQQKMNRHMVSSKIALLPENYRVPVILKDIEGLSLERIAEILNVPQGTVKSRLSRGRRLLHESLQAHLNRSEE